ncbi:hypothetical protein OC834_002400 [Tilletia horrida]|nr:hypothetical protein OC834_002400 [Tilletia horrida]
MPYAPQLRGAFDALKLSWPSAPLRSAALSHEDRDQTSAVAAADFYDDLPSLDEWFRTCRHQQEDVLQVHSGGNLQHRDELCETADARKATVKDDAQKQSQRPRLLVCHDFQGGYNDRPDRRGYTFEYWSLADVFIYFSHRRISCPPAGWNAAGARHGVKMLGTVIFEWKEAMKELSLLLRGPHDLYSPLSSPLRFSPYYIPALIELALASNFSGYLINVELALNLGFSVSGFDWYPEWLRPTTAAEKAEMQRNARRLRAWVALLRTEGRRRFELAGRDPDEWTVLWYDSVTRDGLLQWQDAVTKENTPFLEVSDGIFTNYTWARPPRPQIEQPDMPGGPAPPASVDPAAFAAAQSALAALQRGDTVHPALQHSVAQLDQLRRRRAEAYIGIDVFGRNCWGGAQTWRSLDMIGSAAWWQWLDPAIQDAPSTRTRTRAAMSSELAELGLSVALFAPGWTWEHAEPGTVIISPPNAPKLIEDSVQSDLPAGGSSEKGPQLRRSFAEFAELDHRFWAGGSRPDDDDKLAMVLSSSEASEKDAFKNAVSAYFPARAPPALPQPSASAASTSSETVTAPGPHVLYHTTFARGSGTAWHVQGRKVGQWEEIPSAPTELPTGASMTDEERAKKQKDAEEDAARARVLVGWTDAGVSLPKPDATYGTPVSVWIPPSPVLAARSASTSETEPSLSAAPQAEEKMGTDVQGVRTAPQPAQDGGCSIEATLVEDQVWSGCTSLRLRLSFSRSASEQAAALAVPLAWVPLPVSASNAEQGAEQKISELHLHATAVLRSAHPHPHLTLGLWLGDLEPGQEVILRQSSGNDVGDGPQRQEVGDGWARFSSTFVLPTARAQRSVPFALSRPPRTDAGADAGRPQARLCLIVDFSESVEAGVRSGEGVSPYLEVLVGELALSLVSPRSTSFEEDAPSSTPPTSTIVEAQLHVGRRGSDLAVLSWPDFVPSAHFYEVFARLEGQGTERDEVWLGTATRERARTDFVVPLRAVQSALDLKEGEKRVQLVVRPHGSVWGDVHATVCAE